jgi:cytochrome bd ubiquinol oxidase subunit I
MLASAAAANLVPARIQMAVSLGWHIVIACFGVGFPVLVLFAEWRGIRTGDPAYRLLARRWAKALGVLFAVGAVSGTILSFEMGILWPGLMDRFGAVFGFPFALEGIAFFIEAIFLGIYLYGWDRLAARVHLLMGLPIAVGGLASAWFVVTANSWMNAPAGFILRDGRLVAANPWAGMLNSATPTETTHMILAAYMVTGFAVAAVYAVGMLQGRRDRYHRLGFTIAFTLGAALAPVQGIVGDLSARFVAEHQPAKLAAMEVVLRTRSGVPETLGGILVGGRVRYAVRIPRGLSLLTHFDPNARIQGLDATPAALRPPVNPVHLAFDTMVLVGFGLGGLALWAGMAWLRRRGLPRSAWFLRAAAVAGPAAVVAMEAGWVTTEVGRQPWIVYRVLTVDQAVNPAPGVWLGLYVVLAVYAVLTVALLYVLRRLARVPVPLAPQERDVDDAKVT